MQIVKLSSGYNMPMEGFGVFQIDSPEDCERAVTDAIEAGYRMFDTAMTYGNEETVGRAIRNSGLCRKKFFLTTKVWISDAGYDKTLRAFETSAKNLGTDYLDLYLIHMPLADYYGSWRALETLYKEGRMKSIGVCNFSSARLIDLCYNAEIKPMVNQITSIRDKQGLFFALK